MLNKFFYTLVILILVINSANSNNAFISTSIDGQIITNVDIENESEYLKILNPNLNKLNDKKLLEISKESLINEIIKKNEIQKLIDFEQDNPFIKDYVKNLYSKLDFKSENEFSFYLKEKKNYSLEQIKEKIKIEVLWNELIYLKYKDQIKLDKNSMIKKIELISNKTTQEYLLSEIVFEKKKTKD